jgi:hypothetical protein
MAATLTITVKDPGGAGSPGRSTSTTPAIACNFSLAGGV